MICYLRWAKLGVKPCGTLVAPIVEFVKKGKLYEDLERYKRLVRKLNYLTMNHLDIAYSVSAVSQYMSSPIVSRWAAVEKFLCYLKGAPRCGILYKNYGYTIIKCF